jgi:hypothetical protein
VSWRISERINDAFLGLIALEHRVDPYFRDAFNKSLRPPLVAIIQLLIRSFRPTRERHLCEEIAITDEGRITAEIIEEMSRFAKREYVGRIAERGGNTKTYGVVRAEFQVLDNVPAHLRTGVFSAPRCFPAWIRFSGSGPLSPPDVRDAGIVSIGIKLMGVPG